RLNRDISAQRLATGVDAQNIFAALHIRVVHDDLAIKTAWTQQRRIKNIRAVGGGDDDDVGLILETIHLNENLIQRLFTFIVTTAQTSAALTTHGIDFVDEDDGRGFGFGTFKQIAHTRRTHTNE